jgi:hypothetical protein
VQKARWFVVVAALAVAPVAVGATGCGRIGFDAAGTGLFGDDDVVPVANLQCGIKRTAFGNFLASGELAVTASTGGFYAAWTGTAARQAGIVKLDAQLDVVARFDSNVSDANLTGLLDIGTDVLAAYADYGSVVDLWKYSSDLTIVNYTATLVGLNARRPFVTNRRVTQRAYLSAFDADLSVGFMDENGNVGASKSFPVGGTIIDVAGDNGVTDAAAVWVMRSSGGGLQCAMGSIRVDTAATLGLASSQLVSRDCAYARIATGFGDDMRLVVSTTAGGAVEARLFDAGGDVLRTISSSGRAPKVVFDGTRFWTAWIDNSTGELRIATVDVAGTVFGSAQPGPEVAGDEAFDLVRAGSTVYLVVLSSDALDFVTLCR